MSTKKIGARFVDAVGQVAKLQTQNQLAHALGVTQQTISNWRNGGKPTQNNFVKALQFIQKIGIKEGRLRETAKLLSAVSELEGTTNQQRLAAAIGVQQASISNWKRGAAFPTRNNILRLLRQRSKLKLRIVTEMFQVRPKQRGTTWHLHAIASRRTRLRNLLRDKHGIYVFYDSRGLATYVGMALKMDFFSEIEQRLGKAKLRGKHYMYELSPKTDMCQGQITCRISAYEVLDADSIRPLEAFAIRAFMNGILNRRRESLAK